MTPTEMQEEIDRLKARIVALESQQWAGPPRLGPPAETQQQVKLPLPEVDRSRTETTSGELPSKVRAEQTEKTGQHKAYIVLCEDERQKGFVRPYRDRYQHKTCGTVTTMGRALSETYARDPEFYGATFCCGCNSHHPVSEFRWSADGQVVGA